MNRWPTEPVAPRTPCIISDGSMRDSSKVSTYHTSFLQLEVT